MAFQQAIIFIRHRPLSLNLFRLLRRRKPTNEEFHEDEELKQIKQENHEWFEEMEDAGQLVTESNPFNRNAKRYLIKEQRKFVKDKIIRKKYFSPPKEPALLTWEAREQICHLNKTDPDEWTPERLAESFPVSREIIIKVLKSKWRPHSLKQLYEYNQKVLMNWQKFVGEKAGPVGLKTQKIITFGNNGVLFHCAEGNPKLPKPVTKMLLENTSKMQVNKPVGKFGAIVKGYVDSKMKDTDNNESKHTDYEKMLSDQKNEILQVMSKFPSKKSK